MKHRLQKGIAMILLLFLVGKAAVGETVSMAAPLFAEPGEPVQESQPVQESGPVQETGTTQESEPVQKPETEAGQESKYVEQIGTTQESEPIQETGTTQEGEPIQETEAIQKSEPVEQTGTAQESEPIEKTEATQESEAVQETEPAQTSESQKVVEAKEYVFNAASKEEAAEIAAQYDAELVSFAYGVGVLRLSNINVKAAYPAAREGVKLYPQIYYTVEPLDFNDEGVIMDQWHLSAVKAQQAWEYSRGEGVTVAVIDTGVDTDHEDLVNALYKAITVIPESAYGADGELDSAYIGPEDYFSHGTHVAGIIAAADNQNGCIGIAPDCRILSIKALEKKGKKGVGATAWVVAAIRAAVENGADVINMSIGGSLEEDAFLHQGVLEAIENDVVVVCAAGNISGQHAQVFYPAAYEETICVAAVGQFNDGVAVDTSYSNFGKFIDISAPGTGIMSTMPGVGAYGRKTGTSMACPIVTGAVALLLAKNPNLTNAQVEELLYGSAVDMGAEGWDEWYGNGVLDLENLMKYYIEEYEKAVPISEIPSGSIVGRGHMIKITSNEEGGKVVYTTDKTQPDEKSALFPAEGITAPADASELHINARVLRANGKLSKAVAFQYTIVPIEVELSGTGASTSEIIPLYGAATDPLSNQACKKYAIMVPAGETATLKITDANFTPKVVLYNNDDTSLSELKLTKSGNSWKWKNKAKEAVNVVFCVLDNSTKAAENPLKYAVSWKIEKKAAAAENNSQETQQNQSSQTDTQEDTPQDNQGQTTQTNTENLPKQEADSITNINIVPPAPITPVEPGDLLYTMDGPASAVEAVPAPDAEENTKIHTEAPAKTGTTGLDKTETNITGIVKVTEPELEIENETATQSETETQEAEMTQPDMEHQEKAGADSEETAQQERIENNTRIVVIRMVLLIFIVFMLIMMLLRKKNNENNADKT